MTQRPTPNAVAHRAAALSVFVALLLGAVFVPTALATVSPTPEPTPTPTTSPTPTPVPPAVTLTATPEAVVYGRQVTVSGAVQPAIAGQPVVITLGGALVGTAVTDAGGAYTFTFKPGRSGELVAQLTDGVKSASTRVVVKPRVSVSSGKPVPFADVTLTVKVVPSSYSGTITAVVKHGGATVARLQAATRGGTARFTLPLRSLGAFPVELSLPAADGIAARTASVTVKVKGARLSTGSKGPQVKAMLTALSRLKFRVPNLGSTYTSEVADAVVAFQKAYGLSRDYVFGDSCWRKLETAKVIKARYASPSTHLEVDKGRQIAMVVKNGTPYGIIAISSGATGNTPSGTFHIFIKSLWADSNYGGKLFRSMGFYRDFAMHGYSPVPPYPASHGCVREPMWVAQWMYDQSWVGETVYLYN
jgi:peptidoglycan hydrolase-like protein with peptidoglycan-binding domain